MNYTRDYQRTPMQWDDVDSNSGFAKSGTKTWLPIHPNYSYLNVKVNFLSLSTLLLSSYF